MAAAILPGVRLRARDGGAEGGLREEALRTLVSPRVHRDGDEERGREISLAAAEVLAARGSTQGRSRLARACAEIP